MNSRRGFFSRLAAVVAAVAIAPEIAFRAKLALPEAGLNLDELLRQCYELKVARGRDHPWVQELRSLPPHRRDDLLEGFYPYHA